MGSECDPYVMQDGPGGLVMRCLAHPEHVHYLFTNEQPATTATVSTLIALRDEHWAEVAEPVDEEIPGQMAIGDED